MNKGTIFASLTVVALAGYGGIYAGREASKPARSAPPATAPQELRGQPPVPPSPPGSGKTSLCPGRQLPASLTLTVSGITGDCGTHFLAVSAPLQWNGVVYTVPTWTGTFWTDGAGFTFGDGLGATFGSWNGAPVAVSCSPFRVTYACRLSKPGPCDGTLIVTVSE